jgi:hypothetical protein
MVCIRSQNPTVCSRDQVQAGSAGSRPANSAPSAAAPSANQSIMLTATGPRLGG